MFLKPDQVSLAIGKQGLNIKLASMLTGYVIDVYRDNDTVYDEDIYLDEFNDEIDEWVIDALKDMGCITAKAVLNTPREELIRRADLEEETVDNVLEILRAEFEDEETPAAPEAPAEAEAAAADDACATSDEECAETDPAGDMAAAATAEDPADNK